MIRASGLWLGSPEKKLPLGGHSVISIAQPAPELVISFVHAPLWARVEFLKTSAQPVCPANSIQTNCPGSELSLGCSKALLELGAEQT